MPQKPFEREHSTPTEQAPPGIKNVVALQHGTDMVPKDYGIWVIRIRFMKPPNSALTLVHLSNTSIARRSVRPGTPGVAALPACVLLLKRVFQHSQDFYDYVHTAYRVLEWCVCVRVCVCVIT